MVKFLKIIAYVLRLIYQNKLLLFVGAVFRIFILKFLRYALIAVMNAAVLIGNDEVHWVKNFPDFDVQDMESFANVAIAIMNSKAEILRAKNLREEAVKK